MTMKAELNASWEQRMEDRRKKTDETKAAYAAHMSNFAHLIYLAGEAVKRGELGYADSQHQLAQRSLDAAVKLLPGV